MGNASLCYRPAALPRHPASDEDSSSGTSSPSVIPEDEQGRPAASRGARSRSLPGDTNIRRTIAATTETEPLTPPPETRHWERPHFANVLKLVAKQTFHGLCYGGAFDQENAVLDYFDEEEKAWTNLDQAIHQQLPFYENTARQAIGVVVWGKFKFYWIVAGAVALGMAAFLVLVCVLVLLEKCLSIRRELRRKKPWRDHGLHDLSRSWSCRDEEEGEEALLLGAPSRGSRARVGRAEGRREREVLDKRRAQKSCAERFAI